MLDLSWWILFVLPSLGIEHRVIVTKFTNQCLNPLSHCLAMDEYTNFFRILLVISQCGCSSSWTDKWLVLKNMQATQKPVFYLLRKVCLKPDKTFPDTHLCLIYKNIFITICCSRHVLRWVLEHLCSMGCEWGLL